MSIPFSQRYGSKLTRVDIQQGSMDDRLKNKLWNCLNICYLDDLRYTGQGRLFLEYHKTMVEKIWHSSYCLPIDTIPSFPRAYSQIREDFLNSSWEDAYDFVEFMATTFKTRLPGQNFREMCNGALEEENSAYRFVGDCLVDIISKPEISEIEQAIICPSDPPRELMNKALEEYSNREEPDYPNAIKDSVSAVESLCKLIADDGSNTLGKALPKVVEKLGIDSALASSLEKIWAFRNTKEGVAHGSTKSINVSPEEARLCLITCSAWMNFLNIKAQEKGIQIAKKE